MTSFSEEMKRGQTLAARARLIAKLEKDEALRQMWGTDKSLMSIKMLMALTAVVYTVQVFLPPILQFTIFAIHDGGAGTGTAFNSVTGNAMFIPCISTFGIIAAFMAQMDHCHWKLVAATASHCLCSAAISAYVFLFFFSVLATENDGIPKDASIISGATFLWGMLFCIYIIISFIFLCYTYVSVHDLFSQFVIPLDITNLQEVRCMQGAEEGRVFIRDLKYLRGNSFQYELI